MKRIIVRRKEGEKIKKFRETEVKVGDSTIRIGLKVIFGRDGKYWTGKITSIYTMNRKEFYEVIDAVADDGEVKSFSYLRDKDIS
jgi:protein associated with RNAse G/E